MRSRAILLGVLLALVLPPYAAAKRIPLGWMATVVAPDGVRLVTFRIATLEIDEMGWSAAVSMRNVSGLSMTVRRPFALLAAPTRDSLAQAVVLEASSFVPPMPSELEIGQRWTGTIGGSGTPRPRRYLRFRLGVFRLVIAPQAGSARLDTRQAFWFV